MKKEHILVTVTLFAVILVLGTFIFSNFFRQYSFEIEKKGILLVSNEANPLDVLTSVSQRQVFVVSPQFNEAGSTAFMTESLTLFNSVLITRGKDVETVARVFDLNNILLYCQVNDGNVLENRQADVDECLSSISDSSKVVVLIELPNQSLQRTIVEVSSNKIVIKPKTFEEVSIASFVVLESMYSDTKEIVDWVNVIIDRV